jgi:hypothetical protein
VLGQEMALPRKYIGARIHASGSVPRGVARGRRGRETDRGGGRGELITLARAREGRREGRVSITGEMKKNIDRVEQSTELNR